MNKFIHDLGLAAKDPISEFEGIIVSRAHHLFGCNQYGLAPKKGEDGKVGKTEYFDEARIVVGDVTMRQERENEINKIFKHQLGKEAKDKVTGFEGTLVYAVEYMHGCNQYGLSPKVDAEGKTRDMEGFDEGRLEVSSVGIAPKDVQVEKRGGINRDAPSK